jgi:nitrile hydratase accessory protein
MTSPGSIAEALVADAGSEAAPPRSNGELVFEAPWESRAFAIAVALAERGTFEWERFRRQLIAEIGAWERDHGQSAPGWSYYERWLASLEQVLLAAGLLAEPEIAARVELLEHLDEHEHDHHHHHDHDDHHHP